MRRKLIGGNWKMNGSLQLIEEYAKVLSRLQSSAEIIIAPPYPLIPLCVNRLPGAQIAAQSVHYETSGAFTGEVSAPLLSQVGCAWTIVGHSERRRGLHEIRLIDRVKAAIESGLKVIYCVGESREERDQGRTMDVIREQLSGIEPFLDPDGLIIAYEPVWAIGTGLTAIPQQAAQVHAEVRKMIGNDQIRIIYGGSVNESNAKELLGQEEIDGFLIGGVSLQPTAFLNICSLVN